MRSDARRPHAGVHLRAFRLNVRRKNCQFDETRGRIAEQGRLRLLRWVALRSSRSAEIWRSSDYLRSNATPRGEISEAA